MIRAEWSIAATGRYVGSTTAIMETKMPSAEAVRATVAQYITCMSTTDREGWINLFADDATVEDPVGAEIKTGHIEIGEFWDFVHTLSPIVTMVPTGPVRVADGQAAFPFQIINDFGGTQMELDIIDVMTFAEDAKIQTMRAFWDMADMRMVEK